MSWLASGFEIYGQKLPFIMNCGPKVYAVISFPQDLSVLQKRFSSCNIVVNAWHKWVSQRLPLLLHWTALRKVCSSRNCEATRGMSFLKRFTFRRSQRWTFLTAFCIFIKRIKHFLRLNYSRLPKWIPFFDSVLIFLWPATFAKAFSHISYRKHFW